MDRPFKYFGRGHRQYFHDSISAIAIAKKHYPDDQNAVLSALYHILYDELCSSDPKYKKFLEEMAKLNRTHSKKRKSRQKVGTKKRLLQKSEKAHPEESKKACGEY